MLRRRPRVGIDVDDTLLHFNDILVEIANEEFKPNPPFNINEIDKWDLDGRISVLSKYYHDPEVYRRQTPLDGAVAFVERLNKIADIYFITAVPPEMCGIRSEQLKKYFPMVSERNYIFTHSKDTVDLDFLLDDGGHNILDSTAAYPVLLRRPWNKHMSGVLAVNAYDEFFRLLEQVKSTFMSEGSKISEPSVIVLVGPSGSGKSKIVKDLCCRDGFVGVTSVTTRSPRYADDRSLFTYVSSSKFVELQKDKKLFETTCYAGEMYGTHYDAIKGILDKGVNPVLAMDICGALAVKSNFPACIIFVSNKRENMIREILDKDITNEEKTIRILSLENEMKNKIVADYVVSAKDGISEAVDEIMNIVNADGAMR